MRQKQFEQERISEIAATRTTMADMEARQRAQNEHMAQQAEQDFNAIFKREKGQKDALHEAALKADKEAKEQKRTEQAIAEQAWQALRGAQGREAKLEEQVRAKLREATMAQERSVSEVEQIAATSFVERRQVEQNAVDAKRKADMALQGAQVKQQLLENEARNAQMGAASAQAEPRRVSGSATATRGEACGEAKALIRIRAEALEEHEAA
eukprot:6511749-Pyramimonas_sp.AAC.1